MARRGKPLDPDKLEALALRFRALGEVNRLKIIELLQVRERSVNELAELTGLSQPNVSKHLNVLINAGLLGRRREGVTIFYGVGDKMLEQVCSIICGSIVPRLV